MGQAGRGMSYKAEHIVQVRVRDLNRDVVHPWLDAVRPPLGCIVSACFCSQRVNPPTAGESKHTSDGTLENQ